MKKCHWMVMILLCIFVLSSTCAFAEGTYYDNITHKLGRGVSNIAFSPIELFRSVDHRINEHGVINGICVGTFHGIGRIIGRAFTGVFDTITFAVPTPTFDTYYMEPEFVMINDVVSTA